MNRLESNLPLPSGLASRRQVDGQCDVIGGIISNLAREEI